MSHRRGSLGGLNIHQAAGATKPVALQKRVQLIAATVKTLVHAMGCRLTSAEARELVACNIDVAVHIVADPERSAEIQREADRATTAVVERAVRRREAA